MNITTTFQTDLTRQSYPIRLEAVQNDGNTRALQLTLTAGGQPWQIPAGVTAAVAFRKPDGHKGLYDTLPDGKPAVTVEGNTLTAVLAPQALTCVGQVAMSVVLTDQDLNRLATFPFALDVAADPSAGAAVSNDYYRYSTMEAVSEALESAQRNAPSIVCDRSGMQITVTDAAARPLENLRIFGRTTQTGTPTPDAPAALEHITNPTVTLCGKNLCSGYKAGAYSNTTGNYGSNSAGYYCTELIPVLPGVKYAISVGNGKTEPNDVHFYRADKTWIGRYGHYDLNNRPDDCAYVAFNYYSDDLLWVQVEMGPAATAYEPCKEPQTLTAPFFLPGIPVTEGGNYTDQTGQQWVCDEVDFARGKYVQRVKQIDFADLEWFLEADYDMWRSGYFSGTVALTPMLCETVPYYRIGLADGQLGTNCNAPHNLWVRNGSTVETPTGKALYRLEAPVESELPEQLLAEFAALHTHKPNTTLCAETGVTLSYVADTKTYIDNQFAQLRSALTGGNP